MIGTILIVILVLMLIGAWPTWSHSAKWGYAPSGGLGIVIVILLILILMGRLWGGPHCGTQAQGLLTEFPPARIRFISAATAA
jgi:hypothetical protein